MKKIYSLTIASLIGLTLVGCGSNAPTPAMVNADVTKLDVKVVCDSNKNGLKNVLAVAKQFNPTAKKHQVEFMRFGATTSEYIRASEEAINSGSATANVKQKKKVVKFATKYATERACKFAVRALQQEVEAAANYRKAIPGDQFKY